MPDNTDTAACVDPTNLYCECSAHPYSPRRSVAAERVTVLRTAVERRRNDWLREYDRLGSNPKGVEADFLTARLQELAWVLRLIDGEV